MFLVAPLDDLCDAEIPIMSKWQVKEAMHNLVEDYIERLIGEGEWATVMARGKKHKIGKSNDSGE